MALTAFFLGIKEFTAINREKIVVILAFFVGIKESIAFNRKNSCVNGVFCRCKGVNGF